MDNIQFFTFALGFALCLLGAVLTTGNWANWSAPRKTYKSAEEAALIHGRLGRRLHMSFALLGLGFAIAVGSFLGREKVTAFYWYGVVALALWMSLLAILDGGATWSYVIRVRRELAKKRNTIMSEVVSRAAGARKRADDREDHTNSQDEA